MRSIVEVGTSVPAFLVKLWKLVNDSETDHLILWSPGGKTFIIKNQAEFARSLLPQYYKHNNMASFIRQLNMYGFHKITSVENGGLRYEKDEMEFSHGCFMKGHAYLLEHIKRKIAIPKNIVTPGDTGEKLFVKPELMSKVLADVKQMKGKQESMDVKFSVMKQENESLWREVALLRQKHIKQQQIVNNLIQFLMSLVQPSRPGNMNAQGVKRRYQLMINDAAHNFAAGQSPSGKNPKLEKDILEDLNEETLCDGPVIHELAHDDNAQEDTDCPLDPGQFVTIEIPSLSPAPAAGGSGTPARYQVTLEEGEDRDNVSPLLGPYEDCGEQVSAPLSPLLDSVGLDLMAPPSGGGGGGGGGGRRARRLASPSPYAINPNDMRLPADIFASDDSEAADSNSAVFQRSDDINFDGFILPRNIKQEAGTSNKMKSTDVGTVNLANVKQELQDSDWSTGNMTLATVNNGNRRTQALSEMDDHLDTMQTDLESLRDLLRSDSISLDANTLLGLFGSEDPLHGLSYINPDERSKTNAQVVKFDPTTDHYTLVNAEDNGEDENSQEPNQLISYTGSVPDFGDFSLMEDEETPDEVHSDPLIGESSALNTPQMTARSPFYK